MKRIISICTITLITAISSPAFGLEFDADGRRLDPPEAQQRQYQWTDPNTGKTVTRPYPPANLQMRQTGKSPDGMMVYLEVIGGTRFSDVPLQQAPDNSSLVNEAARLADACLDVARQAGRYKDPDSLRIEGYPVVGFSTETGEVRRTVSIGVNGKNSYGAYAGAKPLTCIFGSDNQTVIEWLN